MRYATLSISNSGFSSDERYRHDNSATPEEVSKRKQEERINLNCTKTEAMVAPKRRISRCELQIGDAKIKQVEKYYKRRPKIRDSEKRLLKHK